MSEYGTIALYGLGGVAAALLFVFAWRYGKIAGAVPPGLDTSRCTTCGNLIRRKYYTLRTEPNGPATDVLCPECYQRWRRKKSKAAAG